MVRSYRRVILFAIGGTLGCAWPPAAQAASPLAEVVKASAGPEPLATELIGAVYDDAILADGGIERTLERLRVLAGGRDRTPGQRAHFHRVMALIHWRHGDRSASLAAVDTAIDHLETAESLLLKARLLDAAGEAEAAVPVYQRALAATDRPEQLDFINIRLTMAAARAGKVEALVDLAHERDRSSGNRAVVALAILGYPHLAIEAYRVPSDVSDPRGYREHVRLAQWALASDAHAVAQREAWLAFEAAGPQADARYALALLAESHREAGSLGDLVADLGRRPLPRSAMLDDLHIDLLIETRRYDEAIAFYESVAGDVAGVGLDARRRLIELYAAVGRTDDMVGEYHRLLSAAPTEVHWYGGLASHYMGRSRPAEALAVWRLFEAANANRPKVLVAGGEQMIGMGFLEEAVGMVERRMAETGETVEGLLFLFEARVERGRNDDALAILERTQALVPPGHSAVRDLVDAYERIDRPELGIKILEGLQAMQDGLGYDERLRLARLYGLADRKQDALNAWRALWADADGPARRGFVENQLLFLAAELNALGDIVVELEEKVYAGRADGNEMGLLVRIYAEVGDTLSATEVIDEFARTADADPVERLRQLADVYRLKNDYVGYDGVVRQLVREDPANELDHVQSLVLNLLAHDLAEETDERYGEIQRWLARLRALDAERVSGEFEAGILALGGFDGEAIESYRRALSQNPENSDTWLLMADQMKSAGRKDEAVTMLQYAAEHAPDDNAFVVAVDGIINMVGTRSFGERLTPESRRILRWTWRVILERVTDDAGKFHLYRMLADVAQETGDTEGVFLALENSLPEAGIRRPAILRELVTLATPGAGFGGLRIARGDPARRLIHGRRLIGLRQALPPDVYINLATALLEGGDVASAEKALDSIEDITGMVDVDRTKAELLYGAGYPERALGHYARALAANRDDIGLLARNALIHEVCGRRNVANEIYMRALAILLRGVPPSRAGGRGTNSGSPVGSGGRPAPGVSRDYRIYFEFMAQGLLGTWPRGGDGYPEGNGVVKAMFEEALQAARATGDLGERTVEDFPRLDHTARLGRRLAATVGDPQLAERIDSALAEIFPAGEIEPQMSSASTPSLLRRHLERARRRGDSGEAVHLARLVGDDETLVKLLRDRIEEGEYEDGLANAWSLLDDTTFRRLVTPFAAILKDDANAFLQFLGRSPHLVLAMEENLAREFVSVKHLVALINRPGGPHGRTAFMSHVSLPGVWRYVKAKGTLSDQVGFVTDVTRHAPRGRFRVYEPPAIARDLLAVELSDEQRRALTEALTEYVSTHVRSSSLTRNTWLLRLLLGIHPANADVAYAIAGDLQDRVSTDIDLVAALADVYEGTPELAFAGLLQLRNAGFDPARASFERSLGEKLAGARERILAAAARGAVPQETAEFAYAMALPQNGPLSMALLRRVAKLAPLDPRGNRYRLDGIDALHQLGEHSAAEQALRDYCRANPGDQHARAALYFRLLADGKFGAALEVVTDGGPDLREEAVVDSVLDGIPGVTVRQFPQSYSGPLRQRRLDPNPGVVQRDIARLREDARRHLGAPTRPERLDVPLDAAAAHRTEPASTAQSLRTVLRGTGLPLETASRRSRGVDWTRVFSLALDTGTPQATYRAFERPGSLAWLLASGDGESKTRRLFSVLVKLPGVVGELERFVPSLSDIERRNHPQLYEILADALAAAGLAEDRLSELSDQLHQGSIEHYGFTLWMTLRHRSEHPLPANELDAFAARAAQIPEPTPAELHAMARLYAKGGAYALAAEHYSLLAARLLGDRRIRQRVARTSGTDLWAVLREMSEVLPSTIALASSRAILAIARPPGGDESAAARHDAFILKVLGNIVPPDDVLAEAVRISPSASSVLMPFEPWQIPKALELIRANAMAGDTGKALALLRRFAHLPPGDASSATSVQDHGQGRMDAADSVATAIGLALEGSASGTPSPVARLVEGRERVFPADPDHAWVGADDWKRAAIAAMVDWLDDADVDAADVRRMLFVAAWQQHAAGEADSARGIVSVLGARLDAEPAADPLEVRNYALLALHVDGPVPADLALAVASRGMLTASEEAAIVREMAAADPVGALRAGRAADRGDKLELMRELLPVAVAANDTAYAAALSRRIGLAETAYRRLGSPGIPGSRGQAGSEMTRNDPPVRLR